MLEIRALRGEIETGERWEITLRRGDLATLEPVIDGVRYVMSVFVAEATHSTGETTLREVVSRADANAAGLALGASTLALSSRPMPDSAAHGSAPSTWGRLKIVYR